MPCKLQVIKFEVAHYFPNCTQWAVTEWQREKETGSKEQRRWYMHVHQSPINNNPGKVGKKARSTL